MTTGESKTKLLQNLKDEVIQLKLLFEEKNNVIDKITSWIRKNNTIGTQVTDIKDNITSTGKEIAGLNQGLITEREYRVKITEWIKEKLGTNLEGIDTLMSSRMNVQFESVKELQSKFFSLDQQVKSLQTIVDAEKEKNIQLHTTIETVQVELQARITTSFMQELHVLKGDLTNQFGDFCRQWGEEFEAVQAKKRNSLITALKNEVLTEVKSLDALLQLERERILEANASSQQKHLNIIKLEALGAWRTEALQKFQELSVSFETETKDTLSSFTQLFGNQFKKLMLEVDTKFMQFETQFSQLRESEKKWWKNEIATAINQVDSIDSQRKDELNRQRNELEQQFQLSFQKSQQKAEARQKKLDEERLRVKEEKMRIDEQKRIMQTEALKQEEARSKDEQKFILELERQKLETEKLILERQRLDFERIGEVENKRKTQEEEEKLRLAVKEKKKKEQMAESYELLRKEKEQEEKERLLLEEERLSEESKQLEKERLRMKQEQEVEAKRLEEERLRIKEDHEAKLRVLEEELETEKLLLETQRLDFERIGEVENKRKIQEEEEKLRLAVKEKKKKEQMAESYELLRKEKEQEEKERLLLEKERLSEESKQLEKERLRMKQEQEVEAKRLEEERLRIKDDHEAKLRLLEEERTYLKKEKEAESAEKLRIEKEKEETQEKKRLFETQKLEEERLRMKLEQEAEIKRLEKEKLRMKQVHEVEAKRLEEERLLKKKEQEEYQIPPSKPQRPIPPGRPQQQQKQQRPIPPGRSSTSQHQYQEQTPLPNNTVPWSSSEPKQQPASKGLGGQIDLSSLEIAKAYGNLRSDQNPDNWMVLGYGISRNVLSLYGNGCGGLSDMCACLRGKEEVLYAYLRVIYGDSARAKFVFFTLVPDTLSGMAKAKANAHKAFVESYLKYYHVLLNINSVDEITEQIIYEKLLQAGGANYGSGSGGGRIDGGGGDFTSIKTNAQKFFENNTNNQKQQQPQGQSLYPLPQTEKPIPPRRNSPQNPAQEKKKQPQEQPLHPLPQTEKPIPPRRNSVLQKNQTPPIETSQYPPKKQSWLDEFAEAKPKKQSYLPSQPKKQTSCLTESTEQEHKIPPKVVQSIEPSTTPTTTASVPTSSFFADYQQRKEAVLRNRSNSSDTDMKNIKLLEKIFQEKGDDDGEGGYFLTYGELREECAQQIEGLQLLLKSMKAKKRVIYPGNILMNDDALITFLLE